MRYFTYLIILLLVGMSSSFSLSGFAGSHPFSVHDMLAMDRISSPAVSPNGQSIVFSLRKTDLEANKGRTDLWLIGIDGKGLRQLTTDPASDSSPCWSKDGQSIYFLSSRSGSNQLWQLPLNGGESIQITSFPLDVESFIISPDGKAIAFSMRVFPGKCFKETKAKLDEIEKTKATGRIYTQLWIRHWDTWMDGRRSHIFVMPLGSGEPVDVMKNMDCDSPTSPWGGSEEYTFTPDSHGIIFTASNNGREEAWTTDTDLYLAGIDGATEPKCLTEENKATDRQPVFSPDGKTLAYLAMKRHGFEADRYYIKLRDWATNKERILAEAWDHSAGGLVWSPDGKILYTNAENFGQNSLFAIDTKTGEVKTLVKEGTISSINLAGDKKYKIIFGLDNLKSPTELYAIDPEGKKIETITSLNKEKCADTRMGDYEQFSFKGANDDTVYGYVVKPVDFDPAKKYPVAFLIHGGPQGSFGNHFHYRWNPQAYTGAGYAAVMIDFHGSTGYGQAFTDAISNDWGGKPLEDLKKGLAAAVEKYPWIDGERAAALGASYGGFMINWIAGNWPDGFKCLVCHDGNLDERFAYYDTEELWFPEWDHGGTPWDNPAGYSKHNPIDHVQNWKTPMLVVHGALDFRVVETQGFSTFTLLQRRGIPSKLLYFPDENHWVLKPHNSILWHDTVIQWLDEWTKK